MIKGLEMASIVPLRAIQKVAEESKNMHIVFFRDEDVDGSSSTSTSCYLACFGDEESSCEALKLKDGQLVTRDVSVVRSRAISDNDALNLLWDEVATTDDLHCGPDFVKLSQLFNTHTDAIQEMYEKKDKQISVNMTELMDAIARHNMLQEEKPLALKRFTQRENKSYSTKGYAESDSKFFTAFLGFMEQRTEELRRDAQDSLKRSIAESESRARDLTKEFKYYNEALKQLDDSNVLECSYIDFYQNEMENIWKERSDTLESLNMLQRFMEWDDTSSDTNAYSSEYRNLILSTLESSRIAWNEIPSFDYPLKDSKIGWRKETEKLFSDFVQLKSEVEKILQPSK